MPSMMHSAKVVEDISALGLKGVELCLYGGCGVDALLEDQTCPRDDLDLIIRADDVEVFRFLPCREAALISDEF